MTDLQKSLRWLSLAGLLVLLGGGSTFVACGDDAGEGGQGATPCDNVECPSNTQCNNADAQCYCGRPEEGGVICAAWQACVPDIVDDDRFICDATLCDARTCENGQSCDPTDGICKCGNFNDDRICGEEQTCINGRCSPDACDETSCRFGTACFDGVCLCGGQDGVECPPGNACEEGACVAADLCDYGGQTVTCDRGQACDSADGLCKCGGAGGTQCSDTERCVDNTCVPDECAGVHCAPGSVCNSTDGLCHCGNENGQVCAAGQSCQETEEEGTFICDANNQCADRNCRNGTTCDPADGQCRCGGVGTDRPICLPDQTCDLETGECQLGDKCRGVNCASDFPGTYCDPEDGFCKCGEGPVGGTQCVTDQVCVSAPVQGEEDDVLACRDGCDPLAIDGCLPGEACFLGRVSSPGQAAPTLESFCAPPGSGGDGATCKRSVDCAQGLTCVLPDNGTDGLCRRVCNTAPGGLPACGSGQICGSFGNLPAGIGVCITP